MAVVRIDDKLLEKLKDILKKEENKYKYNSISSLINSIVYDKINEKERRKL